MTPQIPKAQWIEEVYKLLRASQGAPNGPVEEKNLRDYAETLANSECAYYDEGLSPRDAHDEEISSA